MMTCPVPGVSHVRAIAFFRFPVAYDIAVSIVDFLVCLILFLLRR